MYFYVLIKYIHYTVTNLCRYIPVCGDHHVTIITELCYKCVNCLLDVHLLLFLAKQLLLGFQA